MPRPSTRASSSSSPSSPPRPRPSSSSPPPSQSSKHPFLSRIRVTGGYLDGLDLLFSPGGNVALGEPGSGKSTGLAFLRYVACLSIPPRKLAEFDALIAANLGSGRAYITITTAHGASYELSRSGGESEPRVESDDPNAPSAKAILAMLPIRFAGHGELELLATDGLARLELLTRFAREDIEPVNADLAAVRRELDAGAPALFRLERELHALAERHKTLPAERARLEELKKAAGGDPGELDTANHAKALRERERLMLEAAEREVAWLRGEAGVFAATALRRLGQVPDAEAERGPNGVLLGDVSRELLRIAGEVEAAATRTAAQCDAAREVFAKTKRALAETHGPADDAYRALLAKHEGDAGRAFERLTLEKNVAALEKARDEHAARLKEKERTVAARDRLRARSRALVAQLLGLLDGAAKRMTEATHHHVLVTISPEAERSGYRALLGDLLKGKRFEKDQLDLVSATFSAEDLFALVMRGDAAPLAAALGSASTAGRLVEKLLESERVYELETVDVPHVPVVSLLHGDTHKPSETLSSGQRKQAFLTLMMLDRSSTLVIDQPEDDVAHKYLAGPLCAMFAEVQDEMQFIFVTHDGNIPILGKVRRVIQFESDGRRAWIAVEGEAAAVREPMEDHFEGGRTAFVARKGFYGVD